MCSMRTCTVYLWLLKSQGLTLIRNAFHSSSDVTETTVTSQLAGALVLQVSLPLDYSDFPAFCGISYVVFVFRMSSQISLEN